MHDYDGGLQTNPVRHAAQLLFSLRSARLLKEKRAELGSPGHACRRQTVRCRKEWAIEISWPRSRCGLMPSWQVNLATLPPYQNVVFRILSKDSTNKFAAWNRMLLCSSPSSVERDGGTSRKLRYPRLVLPLEADKPCAVIASTHMVNDQPRHLEWRPPRYANVLHSNRCLLDAGALGWSIDPLWCFGSSIFAPEREFFEFFLRLMHPARTLCFLRMLVRLFLNHILRQHRPRGARRSVQIGALDQPGRTACAMPRSIRLPCPSDRPPNVRCSSAAQASDQRRFPGRRESSFDGSPKVGRLCGGGSDDQL